MGLSSTASPEQETDREEHGALLAQGNLMLNMNTAWRSRDLFKAWPDNVIGLTFMQSRLAREVARKANRPVKTGSYADYSFSLHIYGQDFALVGGDPERGLKSFFDNFDEETYMQRAVKLTQGFRKKADRYLRPQQKEILTAVEIDWFSIKFN